MQLYEANRLVRSIKTSPRVKFRLKPPDGIVSAHECGRFLWEHNLRNPIARVWEMVDGQIQEVSCLLPLSNLYVIGSFFFFEKS